MSFAFEIGHTYVNAAPYAAPVSQPILHRFRCLAVTGHPNDGQLHAIGWGEVHPGVWAVASIPIEHYHPEYWSVQEMRR